MGIKKAFSIIELAKKSFLELLKTLQNNLFCQAKELSDKCVTSITNWDQFITVLNSGHRALAPWWDVLTVKRR